MYSGKTSKLIELYKQIQVVLGIKCLVINYEDDKRYSETELSTHDGTQIPCLQLKNLRFDKADSDNRVLLEQIEGAQVILINEGQFFVGLYDFVTNCVDNGKHVYIAGLDGDFRRNKFGEILDLIPHCDRVTKLTAFCMQCRNGTPAIFSHRNNTKDEQIVIGNTIYEPLCRKCYMLKT
jgi:thymidine kinase